MKLKQFETFDTTTASLFKIKTTWRAVASHEAHVSTLKGISLGNLFSSLVFPKMKPRS